MAKWQPIETAPKDRLIFGDSRRGVATTIMWWPHAIYDNGRFTGAWDDGERTEDGDFEPYEPKWWMEIPAFPTGEE